MFRSKVCLVLTGATLQQNLDYINEYRNWIDMCELRVDFLDKDERIHIRKFPVMAKLPVILTIRRKIDGGNFLEGEASRTTLFARGLAFAEQDTRKNFAYVDLESDFRVPSLQDAAFAFGTRVIRSLHSMSEPIHNVAEQLAKLRITGYEIPKVSFMPNTLLDVTNLFKETRTLQNSDYIVTAMGPLGLPTRILSAKLHSYLTYASVKETKNLLFLGQIDPKTLANTYHFGAIDSETKIFGVMGYPLEYTLSPQIHNEKYLKHSINAVYIPIRAQRVSEAIGFAEQLGIQGLSVTVPHKERVIDYTQEVSAEVKNVGACNTLVRHSDGWYGYNTDVDGLGSALTEFLGVKHLRGWKVSIVGAGGAAKSAAFWVKKMGAKACIFNRTVSRAKILAERYGFEWAPLGDESKSKMENYSDLIIQTTPYQSKPEDTVSFQDVISFYDFKGHEAVFDVTYHPEKTLILLRAQEVGCKILNGLSMLKYQAQKQFELFTGVKDE